jgi:hypothetical protein
VHPSQLPAELRALPWPIPSPPEDGDLRLVLSKITLGAPLSDDEQLPPYSSLGQSDRMIGIHSSSNVQL